jgi:putative transcriptional regulator
MALHNKVRECRFFADEMTQQELAQRVGVTRQTIMAIEKGKYSPSLEVAFKIALVFSKNIDEVFWYSQDWA